MKEVNYMREKLMRFMYGRHGVDNFSIFLLGAGAVVSILTVFNRLWLLQIVMWLLIVYSFFRIFSKNHPKRYAENQTYLRYTKDIRAFFQKQKYRRAQRKTHRIYTCPSCKQKIRIPKGKGKIEVRCPKCSKTFIKRS